VLGGKTREEVLQTRLTEAKEGFREILRQIKVGTRVTEIIETATRHLKDAP